MTTRTGSAFKRATRNHWLGLVEGTLMMFLAACDGGGRCGEYYRPLPAGETCQLPRAVCYQASEGQYCELAQSYSIDECRQRGGQALSNPGDLSLFEKGCPNSGQVIGGLELGEFTEGGLCCVSR